MRAPLAILLIAAARVRTTRSEGGDAAPVFDPIAILEGALRRSPSMRMSLCTFRQSFDARPLSAAEASSRGGGGGGEPPPYALYMCGDSTVRNLFLAACLAMRAPVVGNARGPDTFARCEGAIAGARFALVLRGATGLAPDFVAASRAREPNLPPPSAALIGAGLWMMWPVPFAKAPTEWSTYARWADYERELGASIAAAERARLPRLVLTTTHSQCDATFREVVRERERGDGDRALALLPRRAASFARARASARSLSLTPRRRLPRGVARARRQGRAQPHRGRAPVRARARRAPARAARARALELR